MARIYIARRNLRRGMLLPMAGSKANPSILFPLDKTDPSELDNLVRGVLSKQGITAEGDVQRLVQQAEEASEQRIKIFEARNEVRRLMALRKAGAKLMQVGFRKWKQVFYRPPPATD